LQKTNKNLHLELPSLFYFFMLYKQKCNPLPQSSRHGYSWV